MCLTIGQAIIIRAQNKFGVLEKSAHQTTVRKWRVRCPAGHEVHALVEGIQLRTNEYVQLNNQKYVYNESCMCNRSTPLPYFTKHGSVLVTLFAHHQQAATRVHYICLGEFFLENMYTPCLTIYNHVCTIID